MKKETSFAMLLLFFVFIPICAISQKTKVKPPQKKQESMIPVFRVSPVADSVAQVAFKKPVSKPLLKNVTEKMRSEEIARLSVKAPVDFTLSPRFPFDARHGQLGGDRISIVDLWQDVYLIRPETFFGGIFSLEKNKLYLCTVSLKLYPGAAKIHVFTNTHANESISQEFSFNNTDRTSNGLKAYKDTEITFILKTPESSGNVSVFILDKGTTDFYFKKWNVKELSQ